MNYRYFLCAFLAACALCACGKTNPDKPTPDPPKDLPDVILSQDFTKGLGAFKVQDKDKGGFSGNIYITDGTNDLYVYGCYPGVGATGDARKGVVAAKGIKVGDTLTVFGPRSVYKDVPQVNGGFFWSLTPAN